MSNASEYRRVCITISGYAIVPGNDEEALENVKKLSKHDFDWEKVDADVLADATIIEACGPDGEPIDDAPAEEEV